jgi:hypothetical protein
MVIALCDNSSHQGAGRRFAHHGVSLLEVMMDSAVPLLYAQKR